MLSVPGLGAGALTPTGLWAPLRASLTPTFFRQCLMPTPSPRADYWPKGFRFPRLGPGGCELGRETPPGWAVRRCPERGLGASGGGAADGGAAQPGLTDRPPGVGLGAGDRGGVALVWGGWVPGLGHRTRPCWRLAEAAAGRRSPRCFSRQASGCHWAAAGGWGLPVPPGTGGLGDRALQVRVAGIPVLPGTRASEGREPIVHPLGPWST